MEFRKYYRTDSYADTARRHYRWLHQLDSGVRLPVLLGQDGTTLLFEHLEGHAVEPDDMRSAAIVLGKLHAAAHREYLSSARLDRPFVVSNELTVADFLTPRRSLSSQVRRFRALPVALYKDANVRNFVVQPTGTAVIDFDELTLAPFGYDLAKLIVSCAMTHGHFGRTRVRSALDGYNSELPPSLQCPEDRLRQYATLQHLLTAPYQGRHGYRYSWLDVDSWR
ncbi:phosphotransferase [Nocardia sp. NPDC059246]|uniref:phosphotransferase n=1 Tax=unclassified Nocardia TaxID=2637762 RepID=UPI00367E6536